MARAKTDWTVLRGAFGVLGICALLGGAMLAGSYYFHDAMEKEYRRHQNRFMSISRRYLAVDEEERIIRKLYPRFVALYNRGVIGSEDRLSWLEALRAASGAAGIDELSYRIDSREMLEPEYPVSAPGFEVYASTMTLDMEMRHEGVLVRLLRQLERQAPGLFTVRRCQLVRAQPQIAPEGRRNNVAGACELDWLTLNRSGGEALVL